MYFHLKKHFNATYENKGGGGGGCWKYKSDNN